jgi:N4-gp56 family major capsid protein
MGYAPASVNTTSATLTHLATVYYRTKALDQVRVKFRFALGTMPDVMPLRSGKTIQFYRYSLLTANTTPSSEGTIGQALPLTSTTISATVSEYSDFISISTLLKETAIDPIVANASKELGYRAALSVDTITRTEFDSLTTTVELSTLGATITAQDFRRATALMGGANVQPKQANGEWIGIIHPYIKYDLTADNTAGGFIDALKYANPKDLLSGEVGKVSGVRLFETTNVKTSGTAPNLLYHTYVIGEGAVGAIPLSGSGPSHPQDIDKQNFRIQVVAGGPSAADPEGMIGSYVSYRYVYVVKVLDSVNPRYRVIKADASLV